MLTLDNIKNNQFPALFILFFFGSENPYVCLYNVLLLLGPFPVQLVFHVVHAAL